MSTAASCSSSRSKFLRSSSLPCSTPVRIRAMLPASPSSPFRVTPSSGVRLVRRAIRGEGLNHPRRIHVRILGPGITLAPPDAQSAPRRVGPGASPLGEIAEAKRLAAQELLLPHRDREWTPKSRTVKRARNERPPFLGATASTSCGFGHLTSGGSTPALARHPL